MKLNEVPRPVGRKPRKRRRLGRGDSTGRGGTAGRGHKGQKARAGGFHKLGFEGGQSPLFRRLPKRGFTNIFRKKYAIVNIDVLEKLPEQSEVSLDFLLKRGVVKQNAAELLKILGRGKLTRPLTVKAHACSAEAAKKIVAAGGRVEVVSV